MRSFLVATDFSTPGRAGRRQKATIAVLFGGRSAVAPLAFAAALAPPGRKGGAPSAMSWGARRRSHFLRSSSAQPPGLFVIVLLASRRRKAAARQEPSAGRLAAGEPRPAGGGGGGTSSCQDRGLAVRRQPGPRKLLRVEFLFVRRGHRLGVFVLPGVEQPPDEGERRERERRFDEVFPKRVRGARHAALRGVFQIERSDNRSGVGMLALSYKSESGRGRALRRIRLEAVGLMQIVQTAIEHAGHFLRRCAASIGNSPCRRRGKAPPYGN